MRTFRADLARLPDDLAIRAYVLYNPKATKFRSRRFPLSILSIAAVLEGREEYAIVDGNLDPNATETLFALIREKRVELLAVTVMPGPKR